MTSELRRAVQVAYEAWEEWDNEFGATIDARQKAAAAVIEADREAVRAEVVGEIVAWLREKPSHTMAASAIERIFGTPNVAD